MALSRPLDPAELAERLATGNLYWHVGAGLSMGAGLPSWRSVVDIVWSFLKESQKPPFFGQRRRPAVGPQAERFLAEFQRARVGKRPPVMDEETLSHVFLLNILFRQRGPRRVQRLRPGKLPTDDDCRAHEALWTTRPHGVFTTNYDTLLESSWKYSPKRGLRSKSATRTGLRVYRYSATFLNYIQTNKQFVLKLHGDVDDLREILLDPRELWTNPSSEAVRQCIVECASAGHFVILGASLQDDTGRVLLSQLAMTPNPGGFVRAALFKETEWRARGIRPKFLIQQAVEVLLYREHHDIPHLLKKIARARADVSFPQHCLATDIWKRLWSPR